MAETTVAHLVAQSLARHGVTDFFGVTGSGNFVVNAELVRSGGRFVAARHESGAVSMADAYARVTGRLGVASVHQGPGLTNTLTALVEAVKSRTPMLLLSGDTSDDAVRSNFYVAQNDLCDLLGAGRERLNADEPAEVTVQRAVDRAVRERRPVVLNMPLDVQHLPVVGGEPVSGESPDLAAGPPIVGLDDLVTAVAAAKRPLILAGRGAVVAGAAEAVERLADDLGALLATSLAASGMFTGHPASLGVCGGFASPAAAELVREADLVLGLGLSYTKWTTRHDTAFADDAVVVHVDHDPQALDSGPGAGLRVLGDVGEVVAALRAGLAGRDTDRPRWFDLVGAQRVAATSWASHAYTDEGVAGQIDPRTLSQAVEAALPDERTVVVDGGHFVGFPAMYWSVPDPAGLVFSAGGFQSIGLGLGSAIGAAVARPDRLTVLAIGDGGLHMSLVELETLQRLGLPVLVVVYDDAAYGAEVHHFRETGADLGTVSFPDTDLESIARGFGIRAATVRERADLAVVDKWLADGTPGPLLLDCKVVPTVIADYQREAFVGH